MFMLFLKQKVMFMFFFFLETQVIYVYVNLFKCYLHHNNFKYDIPKTFLEFFIVYGKKNIIENYSSY